MRKFVMITVLLMGVGACAYAIDYPEYKSPVMQSGVYKAQSATYTPYTPYSVSRLGGGSTTWDNNSGGGNSPSGPRRAGSSGGGITTEDGWKGWDSEGNVYYWSDEYGWEASGEKLNPGDPGDPIPVGSPVLPMLLMALLAAGAVYLRRRKALQA